MKRCLTLLAAAALLAVAPLSHAQNWPTKPVRLINPFPAGGGVDAFARPLAAQLTKQLGQTVLVENMGGAGGTVGASAAARATPDGYTFFMGAVHHAIAESLYTRMPYRLEDAFIPVTVVSFVPNVLVVNPKLPFKTVNELVVYAKANPNKLNFGSAGNGTTHHLAGELFKTLTGAPITHVPYKGAGPMMQDLLAGQIDLAFDTLATSSAQIKGGKLRPLAVSSAKRSPLLPDVPTMMEAGVAGYQLTTWYALWAVKGTPQPIVDRMYAEVVKALNTPEIRQLWASQGADPGGMPPADFAKFQKEEIVKWSKVVKDAGAKIDL